MRTNLAGANLTKANLRGADLIGVSLIEADLREAKLRNAYINSFIWREKDIRRCRQFKKTKIMSLMIEDEGGNRTSEIGK